MPAWSGYSKAPKECQKEWDKMWKKLDEHEEGHVEVLEKTVDWTKGSLEKMTDLTVETLKAAVAHEIVHGNENQKAFDDATGHGSKKGVVLNVSAACA
jgi:predicted secreted Zn-dependent protease